MLWLTPAARLRRVVRWVTGDPSSPLADRWTGRLGEWVGIVTPRFSDSVMYRYDKQLPDSAAARGEVVG